MLRLKSIKDVAPHLRTAAVEAQWRDAPRGTRKPSKYRNIKCVVHGQQFDSRLEAQCWQELQLRKSAGYIDWIIRQVPFLLEGGVVYRADFLAVLSAGGVEVIDAKGLLTRSTANKLKQVKARYGVDVILWPKR